MSLITTYVKGQRQKSRFTIKYSKALRLMPLFLLIPLFFVPKSGLTEEKKNNSGSKKNTSSQLPPPPAPGTGSPGGDFSAGGTRDNRLKDIVCGEKSENIVYLLGNRNREFTSSAYPSFWFHISNRGNNVPQMNFVVTEKETGKQIYAHVIQGAKPSGIIGITLPQEEKYALSPQVNYTWSLKADCDGIGQESEIVLEGWITRLVSDSKLEKQLSTVSEMEKHAVYLKHNFFYDALTELAKHHIKKPNNPEIKIAWNDLIRELGWQDLIEQNYAISPSYLDTQISTKDISHK